jgi:hypothetical protein
MTETQRLGPVYRGEAKKLAARLSTVEERLGKALRVLREARPYVAGFLSVDVVKEIEAIEEVLK